MWLISASPLPACPEAQSPALSLPVVQVIRETMCYERPQFARFARGAAPLKAPFSLPKKTIRNTIKTSRKYQIVV